MTGSTVDTDGGFRHLDYDIDMANRDTATGQVVLRVLVPSRSTCRIEVGYAFVDAMAGAPWRHRVARIQRSNSPSSCNVHAIGQAASRIEDMS